MTQPIEDIIKYDYDPHFKYLAPSKESIELIKQLWVSWEDNGTSKPDIEQIVKDNYKYEDSYFKEIISIACRMLNIPKESVRIEQVSFILDSYNLYASHAKDGYLVIVDETFFSMLYSITNILMFSAYNLIDPSEEDVFKRFFQQLTSEYIERKSFVPFHKKEIDEIGTLLNRSYEVTEFAVYLFNSFKTFMLAHEIGHCLLGHSNGRINKMFYNRTEKVMIPIDRRSHLHEYQADIFGYRLFKTVMDTTDNTIDVAYLKYRFEFAPLLLFDIFTYLDRRSNHEHYSTTHPAPIKRKSNLITQFRINQDDLLYQNLTMVFNEIVRS